MKLKDFKFIASTMLLVLVFIISWGVSAVAYESYDSEINGSITINLKDIGTPKDKVELSLYKVGDVKAESNLEFVIKEEYKNSQVDLNSITSAKDEIDAIKRIEPYLKSSSDYKNIFTDSNGIAMWSNLSQGTYLIVAKDSSEYGKISPSLIYIPYTDESGSKWVYDVKIYPKAERPEAPGNPEDPEKPEVNPPKDEDTDISNPPNSSGDTHAPNDDVKTGDDTDYTPYILIATFAILGMVIVAFLKRRIEDI